MYTLSDFSKYTSAAVELTPVPPSIAIVQRSRFFEAAGACLLLLTSAVVLLAAYAWRHFRRAEQRQLRLTRSIMHEVPHETQAGSRRGSQQQSAAVSSVGGDTAAVGIRRRISASGTTSADSAIPGQDAAHEQRELRADVAELISGHRREVEQMKQTIQELSLQVHRAEEKNGDLLDQLALLEERMTRTRQWYSTELVSTEGKVMGLMAEVDTLRQENERRVRIEERLRRELPQAREEEAGGAPAGDASQLVRPP